MKNNAALLSMYRNYNTSFFTGVILAGILLFTVVLSNLFLHQLTPDFLYTVLVIAPVYIGWRCVGWYRETDTIISTLILESKNDITWNEKTAGATLITKAAFFKRMKIASVIEMIVILVGILYMILK